LNNSIKNYNCIVKQTISAKTSQICTNAAQTEEIKNYAPDMVASASSCRGNLHALSRVFDFGLLDVSIFGGNSGDYQTNDYAEAILEHYIENNIDETIDIHYEFIINAHLSINTKEENEHVATSHYKVSIKYNDNEIWNSSTKLSGKWGDPPDNNITTPEITGESLNGLLKKSASTTYSVKNYSKKIPVGTIKKGDKANIKIFISLEGQASEQIEFKTFGFLTLSGNLCFSPPQARPPEGLTIIG